MKKISLALFAVLMATAPLLHSVEDTFDRSFNFKWRSDHGKKVYGQTPGVFAEALSDSLKDVREIVFAVRADGRDSHYYANFGYVITDPDLFKYGGKGGQLCVMDIHSGDVRTILDDPDGDVRDPAVHYDGETILFSYRPGGTHQFHLYTIKSDGTGLTQLTDSEEFDDYEPCWAPDGSIMFVSSRCKRWVPCWYTQVGLMYRCNADGSDIRPISFGVEHENHPWMLPDGRVLYTRWEYVDRGQLHYHGLWAIRPDGTGVELIYDNMGTMNLYIDAKPIPGSDDVVTVISPLHGANEHRGNLGILNLSYGSDSEAAITWLDQGEPKETRTRKGGKWRDPYPVSRDCFFVASDYALMVMNGRGDYEIIHELPQDLRDRDLNIHEPRVLWQRPRERVLPEVTPSKDGMATFTVADATFGRNMNGIERGDIKSLLIMEELPRPAANSMDPDAFSSGKNFVLHRILGEVPVEEDGSAHFKAPAGRPIFFYGLDKDGLSAKVMPSYLSAMPGEQVSCIGCHESPTQAPPSDYGMDTLLALKRPPTELKPIEGIPEIFDYMRDIQPIWDKHCVECHNFEKPGGGLVLSADMHISFNQSYHAIRTEPLERGKLPLIGCDPGYEPDPYSTASGGSKLLEILLAGHQEVQLSDNELLRIKRWADAGTTFAGTYAAVGSVTSGQKINFEDKRDDTYTALGKAAKKVIEQNCADCHDNIPSWSRKRGWEGAIDRIGFRFNVTRPQYSLLLLAPLSREAGGLAICEANSEALQSSPISDKQSPEYQALKAWAEAVIAQYNRPRWFQPGHEPADYYVREMKRYGVLPADFDPEKQPLDGYEVDEAYFRMLYREGPGPVDPTGDTGGSTTYAD